MCSAIGASLCYLLSQLVGRRLVKHYFPDRARQWSEQVDKHRNELLSYILFLRMTPFLPNWFINLVAPVIGVPLYPFALGTFLGKITNLIFSVIKRIFYYVESLISSTLITEGVSKKNNKAITNQISVAGPQIFTIFDTKNSMIFHKNTKIIRKIENIVLYFEVDVQFLVVNFNLSE